MNEYEFLKKQRREIEASQSSPLVLAADQLAQAAEKVHHWHDHWVGKDEGMIVSAKSVRELWEALSNYRKVREGV